MRAKCKVRGEILKETFIFFDSPRQEKAEPQDQIYFMIFARHIRKDQYWLTLKSLKSLLYTMSVGLFYMADFSSFSANRTDGEFKMHNLIGLFS